MKNYINLSIKISGLVFASAILFFIVSLFWYQNYTSVRIFLDDFFVYKNIFLLLLILLFSIIIWTISGIFIKKIFNNIQEYNKKLKDYNHFLAHELKTPIAIVQSNLEVLEYWFDKEKINNSKVELKNMTEIINGLLSFSETVQITNKTDINLENFIKQNLYFIEWWNNIKILNNEFNLSIHTDELLFARIIKNLIENALKYSLDKKVNIIINSDKITFENNIHKTLEQKDIDKIYKKYYSWSYNNQSWNWIWIPMIDEIIKTLGFTMKISSNDYKFIVEIIF
jgi:signal transduction histidine kinase